MAAITTYDCIVIGKGLIGSAAAKYLKQSLEKVILIGPDEPKDLYSAQVFASHYDQSRVQRVIGLDPVWTRLNKQSVAAYPKLEKQSKIQFHYPVGCLYVSPMGKDNYLKNVPTQASQFRLPYQFFENGEAISRAFPHINFPNTSFAMLEQAPSGHINPHQLIKAQLEVFKNNEGSVCVETVVKVSQHNSVYHIKTDREKEFRATKVLVAAGAFTNFFGLLPNPLDLELESETVLQAQVKEDEAQRLSKLPSLLYEIKTEELNGIYLVRPVQYPDGKYYLKIGCNLTNDIRFHSLEQIQKWFREGNSEANMKTLKKVLHTIIPNLDAINYATKRCIISRTKSHQCYIGSTESKNLFVAAGGNGNSAMCSDALGRLASHYTIHEDLPDGYPKKLFEPVID